MSIDQFKYQANTTNGNTVSFAINMSGSTVPESTLDAAAQAFFQSLDGWSPVTEAFKWTTGTEQVAFDWDEV